MSFRFFLSFKIMSVVILCLSGSTSLFAQRLDAIGKEEPLTVGGTISTNMISYSSSSDSPGRLPFTAYLTGALNFDIYGVSMPLTFTYSTQSSGAFQQPFNMVAIHPSYKWITAHIGVINMSFSSHSLSGQSFRGAGVDLAPPGRFKMSAMFGQLQKATSAETILANPEVIPAYKRLGGGIKVGYALDKHAFNLILFKAKDAENSIGLPYSSTGVAPKDNLVVGFDVSSHITSKLTFRLESTFSAITNNLTVDPDSTQTPNIPDMGFVFTSNGSSVLYKAFKTGLDYSLGRYTIGVGYERIDPNYQSLGGYYFTNDLENITANFGATFLKDRAQLALNVGKQRDNLDDNKNSSFSNWVMAANLNYAPTDKLNLNLSYSSFQAYTHLRSAYDEAIKVDLLPNADTLKFTQVSQNVAANISYKLSANEQKVQMINLSGNTVFTTETQGGNSTAGSGGIYSGMLSYSLSLIPQKTTLTGGVNVNYNDVANMQSSMIGPSVGASRAFFEGKLTSNIGFNYAFLRSNGVVAGSALNSRVGALYNLGGSKDNPSLFNHQFGLSAISSNRFKSSTNAHPFSDLTITVSYVCNLTPQKYWLGTKKREVKQN